MHFSSRKAGEHSNRISGNLFAHVPILQKIMLYAIDSHSTENFRFRKVKGDFKQLEYREYHTYFDADGKELDGLYAKRGWKNTGQLPRTGFAPFYSKKEAARQRKLIGAAIAGSEPGERFGIEAIDCIMSVKNAKRLVGLKKWHGVMLKVQLTYNHQNQLATGCRVWDADKEQYSSDGLSDLGKEVAKTLMRGGIIVDVSHLNRQSTLDVCEIGRELKVPVIASHSNPLAVFAGKRDIVALLAKDRIAARCIDDEEIKAILSTGGYVGITSHPYFMSNEGKEWLDALNGSDLEKQMTKRENAWLKKEAMTLLVSHISHVRNIAEQEGLGSRESVAFSSDVDHINANGPLYVPMGYAQKSYRNIFSDLAYALRQKGWKKNDIDALFHGNVERVFAQPG